MLRETRTLGCHFSRPLAELLLAGCSLSTETALPQYTVFCLAALHEEERVIDIEFVTVRLFVSIL